MTLQSKCYTKVHIVLFITLALLLKKQQKEMLQNSSSDSQHFSSVFDAFPHHSCHSNDTYRSKVPQEAVTK